MEVTVPQIKPSMNKGINTVNSGWEMQKISTPAQSFFPLIPTDKYTNGGEINKEELGTRAGEWNEKMKLNKKNEELQQNIEGIGESQQIPLISSIQINLEMGVSAPSAKKCDPK